MTAILAGLVRNTYTGKLRSGLANLYAPSLGSGPILYVSKSGSDSNTGTSLAQAFQTPERAMLSLATGGTIFLFSSGGALTEYSDLAANVAPFGTSYSATSPYGGDIRSILIPRVSGTLGNNCTIMAAPGHEGLVQITGSSYVMGMHMNNKSYWTVWGLRFVGCFKHGIYNPEANTNLDPGGSPPLLYVANDASVSYRCLIENCLFKDIYTDQTTYSGVDNCSAISPWGTKNWVIRNCKINHVYDIDPSKINSAIQAYAQAGLLVEYCDIDSDRGVFIKDHWLSVTSPRTPYAQESEVRYSKFKTVYSAYYIGNKGTNTPESGRQKFHHNICNSVYYPGATSAVDEKFFVSGRQVYGAGVQQSTYLDIYNNIFDRRAAANMGGINASGWKGVTSKGNIFICDLYQYFFQSPSNGNTFPLNQLTASDENIFVTSAFLNKLQKFAPDELSVASLSSWQALTIGSTNARTLQVNNPDTHSLQLTSTAGLFTDINAGNYQSATGSPILGFMQNGTNAGAYQLGTETIGLLPVYSAGS